MRRFLGGVLILCSLVSLLTIGVSAGDDMLLIAPAPSAGSGQREGYTDVPQDHWAAEAIDRYTGLGALQGNPDGSFEPGCLRGFPTPERAAAYYLGLERLFPHNRLCDRNRGK